MLKKELPTWVFVVVIVVAIVIIGVLAWRAFLTGPPKGEVTQEVYQKVQERMREAFEEGKIPKGMKPVPPPAELPGEE